MSSPLRLGSPTSPASPTLPANPASASPSLLAVNRKRTGVPLSQTAYRRAKKQTGPELIASSLQDLAKSVTTRRTDAQKLTSSQEAIERFLIEYASLPSKACVEMIDLLEDDIKAKSFLILPSGQIRDQWVLKRLPEAMRQAAAAQLLGDNQDSGWELDE